MKLRYLPLLFFIILGCSPRNPYYLVHISNSGSQVFFEAEMEHPVYSVTGENVISENTIRCKIPDSLGGAYIRGGYCVVDIIMNNSTVDIKRINIIGLYFYDSRREAVRGFDIYNNTKKRIGKSYNKDCEQYISFVRNFVANLSFKRLTKITSPESHAYCRLIFPSGK
jgi:hypothetical protein